MPQPEKNTKARICIEYKISETTLRKWFKLSKFRSELDKLQYSKFQKKLTPIQYELFVKFFGEP